MPRIKLPPKDFKWTPDLAYAVGLLVTDGNLSGDGRHITLRSKEKIYQNQLVGSTPTRGTIIFMHLEPFSSIFQ